MSNQREFIKQKAGGIELSVRLTPCGSANRIHGWQQISADQMALKVSVTAIPENGKANKALIKLLSKTFKLPQQAIKVIAGENFHTKIIFIEASAGPIEEKLFKINALVAD